MTRGVMTRFMEVFSAMEGAAHEGSVSTDARLCTHNSRLILSNPDY